MAEIKVPKWVEEKLMYEEKILSRWAFFYATNKRLLRCVNKSNWAGVEYNNISIAYNSPLSGKIASIYSIWVGWVFTWWGGVISNSMYSWLFLLAGICFIISGLMLSIFGFYQIESPSFDRRESRKWRFSKDYSFSQGGSKKFAEIVNEMSGRTEITIRKISKSTKVILIILTVVGCIFIIFLPALLPILLGMF